MDGTFCVLYERSKQTSAHTHIEMKLLITLTFNSFISRVDQDVYIYILYMLLYVYLYMYCIYICTVNKYIASQHFTFVHILLQCRYIYVYEYKVREYFKMFIFFISHIWLTWNEGGSEKIYWKPIPHKHLILREDKVIIINEFNDLNSDYGFDIGIEFKLYYIILYLYIWTSI